MPLRQSEEGGGGLACTIFGRALIFNITINCLFVKSMLTIVNEQFALGADGHITHAPWGGVACCRAEGVPHARTRAQVRRRARASAHAFPSPRAPARPSSDHAGARNAPYEPFLRLSGPMHKRASARLTCRAGFCDSTKWSFCLVAKIGLWSGFSNPYLNNARLRARNPS